MGGEGIIAAAIGAVAGGGGVGALRRFLGPERDAEIAEYYRAVIDGLAKENTKLRAEMTGLRERVLALELERDDPPGHLS